MVTNEYNLSNEQLESIKKIILTTPYYNLAKIIEKELGIPKKNYRDIMKTYFPEVFKGVKRADNTFYLLIIILIVLFILII